MCRSVFIEIVRVWVRVRVMVTMAMRVMAMLLVNDFNIDH